MAHGRILLIGGAGMLGRPVARALVARGGLDVVVFTRDRRRAAARLPSAVGVSEGDLRDEGALDEAMRGVDCVYISLNTPFSPRAPFDPDRDGTKIVVEAAKRHCVARIMRLSALEVGRRRDWWALERKLEADAAVTESGLDWTIFRPTWFMESLALFVRGPLALLPLAPNRPLWWIAGADYGEQVATAVETDASGSRVFDVQGPEAVPFRDAVRRFARALPGRRVVAPTPAWAMSAAGAASAQARYGADLLRISLESAGEFTAGATWEALGRPRMSIEEYARSILETLDFPRK